MEAPDSVIVEKFIPGGQALGTLKDGRKIFFWNALPDETVTAYQLTKQKSHYCEAIATAIENPSPHRQAPADPCYLSTSPWQILTYDYELETKRQLLIEQFRQASLDLPAPAVQTDGRDLHYRNKMEYSLYFDHADGEIHLAFHARGSHRKIPITKSSIERPEIWQRATEIVADLNQKHADARAYQSLLLRCDQQGNVSGGLYENHRPHPVFPPLTDTLLGHAYSYSPNGFFQINLPVYELALTAIAKHITTDQVLDLYSGVGTIGLSTAPDKHLTLVECDKSAFSELYENSKRDFSGDLTNKENAKRGFSEAKPDLNSKMYIPDGTEGAQRHDIFEFKSGSEKPLSRSVILTKSEEALDQIRPTQTVILDPPRAGCHPALLAKLLEQTPPTIIYLSCNPATQARDAKILTEKYQITHIQPFNFFPKTPHLENLLVFTLKSTSHQAHQAHQAHQTHQNPKTVL